MLAINGLEFGFADQDRLVSNLCFCTAPGDVTLVQGASGCGKSTLLGIISGTAPSNVVWQGDITLNERQVTSLPTEQRQTGILFQDPLLFPHLTVGDNLAFGLEATVRGSARVAAVTTALEQAGMAGFGSRDPASLSGGQAARIGLMRALLAAPQALLLDEPFAALDADLVQKFGGFVHDQIHLRNIPAVMVSHDKAHAVFAAGAPIQL